MSAISSAGLGIPIPGRSQPTQTSGSERNPGLSYLELVLENQSNAYDHQIPRSQSDGDMRIDYLENPPIVRRSHSDGDLFISSHH